MPDFSENCLNGQRREKESLSLSYFSQYKMGQDLPLHCPPWKTVVKRSYMLQAGHLASFNLQIDTWFSAYSQNSEIMLVADVGEFRKKPISTLLHALW